MHVHREIHSVIYKLCCCHVAFVYGGHVHGNHSHTLSDILCVHGHGHIFICLCTNWWCILWSSCTSIWMCFHLGRRCSPNNMHLCNIDVYPNPNTSIIIYTTTYIPMNTFGTNLYLPRKFIINMFQHLPLHPQASEHKGQVSDSCGGIPPHWCTWYDTYA